MPWWLTTPQGSAGRPTTLLRPQDEEAYDAIVFEYQKENNAWMDNVELSSGHRLPTPETVFQLSITSGHRELPDDFVNGRIGRAVSERVVDLIERLEPGVHGFWPIDVSFRDGAFAGRRWLLNVGNRLDTLDLEKSKIKGNRTDPNGRLVPDFAVAGKRPLKDGPKLLFCRSGAVGRHAIWCEYRFYEAVFVSDELHQLFLEFTPNLIGIDFQLQASLI
ncbi:hypothetical protein IWQ55_005409 [Labrenzia sp. EL_208]|nr:hypothetical protein [Labrenzia sp. EL_132]MBG6232177.1 hypothetical protein [Labrenzia sp. EL_208]